MKELREFQINIFNLANGSHEFEFEITDKLFENRDYSLIERGRGQCKIQLIKSETMLNLHLDIEAETELICDRSLDLFWYPMSLEEDIIIKYGEDNYSLSEDVLVIKHETSSINVGDFIYEFLNLAVPMKKLHPRFGDEDENEETETLIYSSLNEQSENEQSDKIDPRWEALKKLKE
jgi:uncharacterized protein